MSGWAVQRSAGLFPPPLRSPTEHGFEHLESEGVTHRLEKMVTAPDDSPMFDYVLPGGSGDCIWSGRTEPLHPSGMPGDASGRRRVWHDTMHDMTA